MTYEELETQINAIQMELAANGPLVNGIETIRQLQHQHYDLIHAFHQIPLNKENPTRWLGIWEQLEELTLQLRLEFDLASGGDARDSKRALELWYQAGESRRNSTIAVKPTHYLSLRKERKLNA
jgi:hypothetical protein